MGWLEGAHQLKHLFLAIASRFADDEIRMEKERAFVSNGKAVGLFDKGAKITG